MSVLETGPVSTGLKELPGIRCYQFIRCTKRPNGKDTSSVYVNPLKEVEYYVRV